MTTGSTGVPLCKQNVSPIMRWRGLRGQCFVPDMRFTGHQQVHLNSSQAEDSKVGRKDAPFVKRSGIAGFSLLELVVVVGVGMVLAAIALPMTINAAKNMRLTAAVSSATGAIQSSRFLAIMNGYPYQITFTPATNSYQVLSDPPPAGTFVNVGTAVPISGPGAVTISRIITLQFYANGTITEIPATGNMIFSITNAIGGSRTLAVSSVGNVTVTSP
jgi:type II secretory pathway pseudopilin PulG